MLRPAVQDPVCLRFRIRCCVEPVVSIAVWVPRNFTRTAAIPSDRGPCNRLGRRLAPSWNRFRTALSASWLWFPHPTSAQQIPRSLIFPQRFWYQPSASPHALRWTTARPGVFVYQLTPPAVLVAVRSCGSVVRAMVAASPSASRWVVQVWHQSSIVADLSHPIVTVLGHSKRQEWPVPIVHIYKFNPNNRCFRSCRRLAIPVPTNSSTVSSSTNWCRSAVARSSKRQRRPLKRSVTTIQGCNSCKKQNDRRIKPTKTTTECWYRTNSNTARSTSHRSTRAMLWRTNMWNTLLSSRRCATISRIWSEGGDKKPCF